MSDRRLHPACWSWRRAGGKNLRTTGGGKSCQRWINEALSKGCDYFCKCDFLCFLFLVSLWNSQRLFVFFCVFFSLPFCPSGVLVSIIWKEINLDQDKSKKMWKKWNIVNASRMHCMWSTSSLCLNGASPHLSPTGKEGGGGWNWKKNPTSGYVCVATGMAFLSS